MPAPRERWTLRLRGLAKRGLNGLTVRVDFVEHCNDPKFDFAVVTVESQWDRGRDQGVVRNASGVSIHLRHFQAKV